MSPWCGSSKALIASTWRATALDDLMNTQVIQWSLVAGNTASTSEPTVSCGRTFRSPINFNYVAVKPNLISVTYRCYLRFSEENVLGIVHGNNSAHSIVVIAVNNETKAKAKACFGILHHKLCIRNPQRCLSKDEVIWLTAASMTPNSSNFWWRALWSVLGARPLNDRFSCCREIITSQPKQISELTQ